jgi:hypothetical protein
MHATAAHAITAHTVSHRLLVLLEARRDAAPHDQHAMLGEAWSTQFTWPGVLCASGGRLDYPASAATAANGVDGFTHGVHFRFNSSAQALAFLRSQRVQVGGT